MTITEIIDRLQAPRSLMTRYESFVRHYHNVSHVEDVVNRVARMNPGAELPLWVLLAAVYHDIVHNPTGARGQSEAESVKVLYSHYRQNRLPLCNDDDVDKAAVAIIMTGDHIAGLRDRDIDKLTRDFLVADVDSAFGNPYNEILIYREYQSYPLDEYRRGRRDVLELFRESGIISSETASAHLAVLHGMVPRIAVFPGTFTHFHAGHLDILRRASAMFDKVVIAYSSDRKYKHDVPEDDLPQGLKIASKFFKVVPLCSSIADFLHDDVSAAGATHIIRGIRDATDFDYEERLRAWYADMGVKADTVYIPSDAKLKHVSSSGIIKSGLADRYEITTEHSFLHRGETGFVY